MRFSTALVLMSSVALLAACDGEAAMGIDAAHQSDGGFGGDAVVADAAVADTLGDVASTEAGTEDSGPVVENDGGPDGVDGGPDAGLVDAGPPPPAVIEGYGNITVGGAGGDTCTVTTLDDDGPGSLRDCVINRAGPRVVEFDVGGTITLLSDIVIEQPYLTIDGSTAPAPGITIDKRVVTQGAMIITSTRRGFGHDIIVSHLRFDGGWDRVTEAHGNNEGTIAIDGENTDEGVWNVVLDHLVVTGATDSGGDMWGEIRDVTVSWCIFMHNLHPMTISHNTAEMVRQRISVHHNIFAYNHERSPQVRANVRDLDYVNNILYEWKVFGGGYGIRLRHRVGVWPTDVNIVNNFFHSTMAPGAAILYEPTDFPGDVYISGNRFQSLDNASLSTVMTPIQVPAAQRVTTSGVDELAERMLSFVGIPAHRSAEEQELIDDLRALMPAR